MSNIGTIIDRGLFGLLILMCVPLLPVFAVVLVIGLAVTGIFKLFPSLEAFFRG